MALRKGLWFVVCLALLAGCSSDRTTISGPELTESLLEGQWAGVYKFECEVSADSTESIEATIEAAFSGGEYSYTSDYSGPCGIFGGGVYSIDGRRLKIEDQTIRMALCDGPFIIHGNFTYVVRPTSDGGERLHLFLSRENYKITVDLTKIPRPILY